MQKIIFAVNDFIVISWVEAFADEVTYAMQPGTAFLMMSAQQTFLYSFADSKRKTFQVTLSVKFI